MGAVTLDTSNAILALILSTIALVGYVVRLGIAIGRMSVKVDTLWHFLLTRAKVEAVQVGWGEMESPIKLNSAGLAAITPILAQMIPLYAKLDGERKAGVTDEQFEQATFEVFGREFGEVLAKEICIPHGVSLGACLVAAVAACKEVVAQMASGRISLKVEPEEEHGDARDT